MVVERRAAAVTRLEVVERLARELCDALERQWLVASEQGHPDKTLTAAAYLAERRLREAVGASKMEADHARASR